MFANQSIFKKVISSELSVAQYSIKIIQIILQVIEYPFDFFLYVL